MTSPLRIEAHKALTEAQREAIIAPLAAYSRRRGFGFGPNEVGVVLMNGGAIAGGLIGSTNWQWLYIEVLGIEEPYRGRGWGRALVERAETIALERGCHGAWVDTFTFQSPGFYEKLGYRLFGELPDYPNGHRRLFYFRELK
jgi:GNAT superfamily N-acetyltransferase